MARRRSVKKHTAIKIAIAVVAILLIVAIALGVFYAVAPDKFNHYKDLVLGLIKGPEDPPAVQPTLEGTLEMTVIDIGQGDCIFLQFPDGQTMIMDAGSTKGGSYESLQEHLELRGVEYIDYVFITHTDQDHIKYLPELFEDYQVHNIYMPYIQEGDITTNIWTETYDAIYSETYVDTAGNIVKSQVHYNIGDYEISGTDWKMTCHSYLKEDYPDLTQDDGHIKNGVSPICFLEYADRTIVLTGDSNDKNEPYLLERGVLDVDADVLKVAHHGSESSTCDAFLEAVDCEYAIISYGEGNQYRHPTPELMDRLENYRDKQPDDDYNGFKYIYETAKDGNVGVFIDGDGTLRIDCENTDDKDFSLAWGAAAASLDRAPVRRYEVELAA